MFERSYGDITPFILTICFSYLIIRRTVESKIKKKLEKRLLNWVEYARKKQDKRVIQNEQVFYIYNFDNDNVIGGL